MNLNEFLTKHKIKINQEGFFLDNDNTLNIALDGEVSIKTGAMIGYTGQMEFVGEGLFARGLGVFLKRMVSGKGGSITKAKGKGQLLVADEGKKVILLSLQNETLIVNGKDILAFAKDVNYSIRMMQKMASVMNKGLFSVNLEGTGQVAFTSYGTPIVVQMSEVKHIFTDPNATIAWSGNLKPEIKTDIGIKNIFGMGGGENFQMEFKGEEGFIIIQPCEGIYDVS